MANRYTIMCAAGKTEKGKRTFWYIGNDTTVCTQMSSGGMICCVKNITGVTGAADSVSPGICRKKECDKMIYFQQIKTGAADRNFSGCAVRNLQKGEKERGK